MSQAVHHSEVFSCNSKDPYFQKEAANQSEVETDLNAS